MHNHKYGLRPDPPDNRDKVMMCSPYRGTLPTYVDLRSIMPPVYNQGELGSCTANAIGAALDCLHKVSQKSDFFTPSRLFIYYNERVIEGTIFEDVGASIRTGMKSVNRDGACRESTWEYDINKFAIRPHDAAYAEAMDFQSILYTRVPIASIMMKSVLASGYPVICGIQLYSSFESDFVARTGYVPMPNVFTEQHLGGHAVCIVGYDDKLQCFIVRNSWGENWGIKGHFYLPYAFVDNVNLTADAWTIKSAE